jgi:hypothetical protein
MKSLILTICLALPVTAPGSGKLVVDWNAVAALAGVAAAVAAIAALVAESRRSRFAQAVELLLRFEDRFASPDFLTTRRRAAEGLATGKPSEVDDVLDFFETIGMLVQKKALDKEMVWSSFAYWLLRYTAAARKYISESRSADPAVWRNLVYLRNIVDAIETREGGTQPTPDDIARFLSDEKAL